MTRHLVLALILAASSAVAAPPPAYHLELEAYPASAFPYLSKFGKVEIHIYGAGARAEFLWLNAFSRNGARSVTVTNPLGRMFVEVPVEDISKILGDMAGSGAGIERISTPLAVETQKGTVKGIAATRHRIVYGEAAHLDYWTAATLKENPQASAIVQQILTGISPATAKTTQNIRGVPLYVELNFRRFKKVPLVTMKKLRMSADDEADALERGPLYVRASVLEKLWAK